MQHVKRKKVQQGQQVQQMQQVREKVNQMPVYGPRNNASGLAVPLLE